MHKTHDWNPTVLTGGILPDEPAHGLYLRLSDINGIPRAGQFWTMTSVRLSRVRFGDDLDGLARISKVDIGALEQATYKRTKGDNIVIGGNHLKLQEAILLKSRRLCRGCLADSMHHRFWWDIGFITSCPMHRTKLINACSCGGKLSWYDGQLDKCGRCADGSIENIVCEEAHPDVTAFDSWVLRRFSIGDAGVEPEVLDGVGLSDAVEIVERIASLDLGGYAERWVEIRDLAMAPDLARAHGFRLIVENRIGEALDKAFDGFRVARPDEQPVLGTAYGWFHTWFRQHGAEKFSEQLARIILDNAGPKFQVIRDSYNGVGSERKSITISEAKDLSRVSARTMRKILEHEGKIRDEKRKGSPVMIDRSDATRIARDLSDALPLVGVERLLGVGRKIVQALVRDDILPIWVPGGALGDKHRYLFRTADIEKWIADLVGDAPSVDHTEEGKISVAAAPNGKNVKTVTLYRAVLNGEIKIRGILKGAIGMQGALVSIADVLPYATQRHRGAETAVKGDKRCR